MKNKKNLIIVSMMVVVAVMAIGYSYFATRLNINATGNITSQWNVYFSNITAGTVTGSASNKVTPSVSGTTANMEANLSLPGDSITYELTLTNAGTIGAIIEDIEAQAEGSSAIIYSISGLKIGDKLAAGASKVITVKIEYDTNVTSQPSKTSKTLTVNIDAVQDIGQSITTQNPSIEYPNSLVTAIMRDNTPQADTNIDFSKISSDTNGKGLYYTSTNTEDTQRTYYFRGAVENNYVKFATHQLSSYVYVPNKDYTGFFYTYEECMIPVSQGAPWTDCIATDIIPVGQDIIWRIVRINEDGSIRLITDDLVSYSVFNDNDDDNAYVGYMYGTPGSLNYADTHANINDSNIKKILDNWYTNTLDKYSTLIGDAGFCNDRSIAGAANSGIEYDTALGYGTNWTFYGPFVRVYKNKQPQFACPNEKNDLFTLSTSNKGNKKLTNPIGLLTADEVAYAGGAGHQDNSNYYLANNVDSWTMSSASVLDSGTVWGMTYTGALYFDVFSVDRELGVRPVINLKSSVEITGGDGTESNPYVIKIN